MTVEQFFGWGYIFFTILSFITLFLVVRSETRYYGKDVYLTDFLKLIIVCFVPFLNIAFIFISVTEYLKSNDKVLFKGKIG
jgi:hypothetical protein